MKLKARKYFQIALRLLVSGVALFYVFRNINLHSLGLLIRESDLLLIAASLLLFVLSKVISSYRLNVFFKAEGILLTERANLKLYWLGMFYNLFLPGGIGGDGYKVYYLNKNLDTPLKKGILAILFDRVTGLLALVIMCLIFVIFVRQFNITWYLAAGTCVLVAMGFYFIVYRWFTVFFSSLNKTNLLSLGVQTAQLISALMILLALGQNTQIIAYLFVFLVSSVVAVIPFTIGGVGAREITFLYAADLLSLDVTTSVSLSLMFFFITAFTSLVGMVFGFRPQLIQNR